MTYATNKTMKAGKRRMRSGRVSPIAYVLLLIIAIGIAWSLSIQDVSASNIQTPNPSKAPWYFLSLGSWITYLKPGLAGSLPSILDSIPGIAAIVATLALGAAAFFTLVRGPVSTNEQVT